MYQNEKFDQMLESTVTKCNHKRLQAVDILKLSTGSVCFIYFPFCSLIDTFTTQKAVEETGVRTG